MSARGLAREHRHGRQHHKPLGSDFPLGCDQRPAHTPTDPRPAMAPSRADPWYVKVAQFDVAELFAKKREPGPPRTVFVNEPLPGDYYDQKGRIKKEHVYISNQVITSKYTVITFLPRNLLEQFRRVANVYVAPQR
jgi:hypothetical protein